MSQLATLLPTSFPPLPALADVLEQEITRLRAQLAAQVQARQISQAEARYLYDCRRAWLLLVQAEIRRGKPWPMLSPTPGEVLEWLERRVRQDKRSDQDQQMPFWNVLRWLVLADIDHRASDPHEFSAHACS